MNEVPTFAAQRVLYNRAGDLSGLRVKIRMALDIKGFALRSGTLDASYEDEAWHQKDLSKRFISQYASDVKDVKTDMISYDLRRLGSKGIEKYLKDQGFRGLPVPNFYNPLHSAFTAYSEFVVDGRLVLAKQCTDFYRYTVVPDVLLKECGINVNPSYAW